MVLVKLPMRTVVVFYYTYCGAVGGLAALVLSASNETHTKVAMYAAGLNDLSGQG
jgi:hypothetical protein